MCISCVSRACSSTNICARWRSSTSNSVGSSWALGVWRTSGRHGDMTVLADIGLGTLFSGNAGLLQLTLLPGLLAHEWQTRSPVRMPALDSLLFVFAASAVASFLLVLLLQ